MELRREFVRLATFEFGQLEAAVSAGDVKAIRRLRSMSEAVKLLREIEERARREGDAGLVQAVVEFESRRETAFVAGIACCNAPGRPKFDAAVEAAERAASAIEFPARGGFIVAMIAPPSENGLDIKRDKKKKSGKRPISAKAAAAGKYVRKRKKQDPTGSRIEFVREFTEKHGGNVDTIDRALSDHPELWKPD